MPFVSFVVHPVAVMNRKALHYAVVLAVICVVAAAGVAGTFVVTRDRIQAGEQRERAASQERALKAARFEPAGPSAPDVMKALDANGQLLGYVALGESQGYGGKVRVMVGLDAGVRTVRNVVVVTQNETPGLGTRVCDVKSDRTWWAVLTGPAAAKETDATPEFLRQFQDRPCDKLVLKPALPDGVQAITGATVSSRAVLNAARNAVERVRAAAGADAPQPPAPAKPKSADAVSGATSYAAPAASPTSTLPGARPKP